MIQDSAKDACMRNSYGMHSQGVGMLRAWLCVCACLCGLDHESSSRPRTQVLPPITTTTTLIARVCARLFADSSLWQCGLSVAH